MGKTYSEKLKDPRWQKKRLKILERDEFSCRICGNKKSTLHIHHISYNENPWETNDKLLITLCEDCHKKEEIELKLWINKLIKILKNNGFISLSFANLCDVFNNKDRGWTFYEPSFDIISMVINDDKIWNKMYKLYWNRLNKKYSKKIK